jgi:hypothetical protein
MDKKRKISKKHAKPAEKNEKRAKPEEDQFAEEKPFDFGGLPSRDLKKNLGCG